MKGHPFEVVLPPALQVSGAVLVHQIRTIDWTAPQREVQFLCSIPSSTMKEIVEKLELLLIP